MDTAWSVDVCGFAVVTSLPSKAINSSRSNDNAEEEVCQITEFAEDLDLVVGSFWPALQASIPYNCSIVTLC